MMDAGAKPRRRAHWPRLLLASLVVVLVVLITAIFLLRPPGPVAEVRVADGRIIIVEAVTYGTNHIVGNASVLVERFGPWMPKALRSFLTPRVPQSRIAAAPDTLVVWLNAVDANARTNVDCQGLRLEFVDAAGDLWTTRNSHWHSHENHFHRIGHVFEAYPRAAADLTLRLTPWRSNETAVVTFPNPRRVQPEQWAGESPPVKRVTNGWEIVLLNLHARTNGGPDQPWMTPSRYWEPEWRLLAEGAELPGWREPEWSASDPFGNRGQWLGLHQPVLRYMVTFLPDVTNQLATTLIASLPAVALGAGATNVTWFQTNVVGGDEFVAIGLMTTAINFFTDGEYQAVPPVPVGPTRGGPKTGWVSASKRVTPVKVLTHRGHFADRPVIYLQCRDAELAKKLGVRLRDEQGRLWPTTREEQGNPDGVQPFMLDAPPAVTRVTPEIVELKPLSAVFDVRTPAP